MPNSTLSTDNLQASPPAESNSSSPNILAPFFDATANLAKASNNIIPGPNNPNTYQQARSLSKASQAGFKGNEKYDQYTNKSLATSLFNALIKNYAKAVNSTVAEIIRNVLTANNGKGKDSESLEQTPIQEILKKPEKLNEFVTNGMRGLPTLIHSTFFDSLPARLGTDLAVGFIIPIAHKLGISKFINEDILQGMVAAPFISFFRGLTNSENQQTLQTKGDCKDPDGSKKLSPKEEIIKERVNANPGWLLSLFNKLSTDGVKYIRKPLNKFLEIAFGIKAPETVIGSDGTALKDSNTGIDLKYTAKVNPLHFLSGFAASIGLTFLIKDKSEAPTGFGEVHSPFSGVRTLFTHVISRIHSDMFAKMNMSSEGKSFDFILTNSIFKKLPGPFTQYIADAGASSLRTSKIAKTIGTVPLSLMMRMGFEIFQPLFTQGNFNLEEENRIPDEYKFLGHKLLKPGLAFMGTGLKPLFKGMFKHFYSPLTGLFPSVIDPNTGVDLMYEDMGPDEQSKAGFSLKGVPDNLKHMEDKYESAFSVASLALKSVFAVPAKLFGAFKEAASLNKKHDQEMDLIKTKYNERKDLIEQISQANLEKKLEINDEATHQIKA